MTRKVSDKRPEKPKDIFSPDEVKGALAQALVGDLLDELLRRSLIGDEQESSAPDSYDEEEEYWENRFREILRRRESQERLQEIRRCNEESGRETLTLEEEVESLRASGARHREYVGRLFDLLHQKRLEKMQERCIWRTDTALEFAGLGVMTTKTIFDHLVIARRDALDAGTCDIESLWEYLMSTGGYKFASDLVEADIYMRPNTWSSFIYQMVQGAAMSFLDIAEEDTQETADQDNENGCKKPDFIN